jgi:hypothetical protein
MGCGISSQVDRRWTSAIGTGGRLIERVYQAFEGFHWTFDSASRSMPRFFFCGASKKQ